MSGGKLFAFGYGATAAALGDRLLAKGWSVAGTCQTEEKAQSLSAAGVKTHIFDADHPLSPNVLAGTTHLLISIPPERKGDDHVLDRMTSVIEDHHASLEWIGYLSTTGVYGDRGGDWVDESDELRPTSDRGRRRVAAEKVWFDLGERWGVPVQSFRLAGIYGPGRNQIVSLRTGKARRIVKPGHVFSRIHVDDIATVLEASIARPRGGAAYNVCDNEAAPPQDVVAFAASLAGFEVPPEVTFEDANLTPMARSFYAESKRVSNSLIKRELGVMLRYPTYREGLRALYEAGE
ncbi:MAG: SDR family oxidoreductase [Rhodobiaceae bacterium]|nr:SDR family oxidoreductase [Rhodobiaceae bacterium]